MIAIIIMFISLMLDGFLSNFLPYLVNDLSYFTPLFTLISVFLIYPFYRKDLRKYLLTVFILGIVYDLFYTNLLFFNGVLFVLIGLITALIQKNFEVGFIKLIFYTIIIVASYELITGLVLYLYQMFPINIDKVYYKITHSLISNIIYAEVVFIVMKFISKKYKKISM